MFAIIEKYVIIILMDSIKFWGRGDKHWHLFWSRAPAA